MPVDVDEYKRIKERADAAAAESERAAGALDQLTDELRERFGCETIGAAKEKLAQLNAEADASEAKYEREKAKFEKKWREKLDADW